MRYLIAFLLVIAMGAPGFAQEKTYTMTLPAQHWEKVGEVLSKEPYRDVWQIIHSLITQARNQDEEAKKRLEEKPR